MLQRALSKRPNLFAVAATQHRAPTAIGGARLVEEEQPAVVGSATAHTVAILVDEEAHRVSCDGREYLSGAHGRATCLPSPARERRRNVGGRCVQVDGVDGIR